MKKENRIKISNSLLISALFLFAILIVRVSFLALSTEIDNINIQELASKRTTKTTILKANRGTIFDNSGNVLAQDVSSYTLIAYLDSSRTTDEKKPKHVVDKENTALVLSAILGMEYDTILSYLSKEGIYQTEFGNKGRGLTEIMKDTIKATNLPGIDFVETKKRYYPYGEFLSYLVGYAKSDEEGAVIGELGIEKYYNNELTGVNGKNVYQKDLQGYKIAGTNEVTEDKNDGSDIYLTIDNNVQFFLEQAIKDSASKYDFEEITIIIASAKTGEILGYSSNPSFDPNTRNITNYLDPNSGVAFEPGSTMKIYTYMAALESGVYKGSDTFSSGSYITKDNTVIRDWNRIGWGTINYDQGFIYSSNTGVVNLMDKYLDSNFLKNYLKKLGFASKTGISVPNEVSGKVDFKYETEIFNAAFGQGITTTPIQHIKALTSISNNGEILSPFIIKKIVASDGTETLNKRNSLGKVASVETVEYMKNLMWHTINDPDGAGVAYKIDGFDIIGKTGTAQIASTNGKGYLTGDNDVIKSISLMFPKDSPEIIIYGAVKRTSNVNALSEPVKEIIKNISKYYNLYNEDDKNSESNSYQITSFINKNLDEVKKTLNDNNIEPTILGNGKTIIAQYPSVGTKLTAEDHVFLLTNDNEITMPNVLNYSRSDIEALAGLLKINYNIKGSGYVKEQSIKEETVITKDIILEVTLENHNKKSDDIQKDF